MKRSAQAHTLRAALGVLVIASLVPACTRKKDAAPATDSTTTTTQPQESAPPASPEGGAPIGVTLDVSAQGPGQVTNVNQLVDALGLRTWHGRGQYGQNMRIAILDNGFAGLEATAGRTLPAGLKVEPAPGNPEADTSHGRILAELVYAVATGRASPAEPLRQGPELLLYNSNGFTNFAHAVSAAIDARVDVILYSQVWEYGGNFQGGGFINEEVSKAVRAGILWINAAGNFGESTWLGPVQTGFGHDVILPHQNRWVRFTVPAGRQIPVKIVLAWNDVAATRIYRTSEDLDLILEDSTGRELNASRLIQDGTVREGDARFSAHAREIIRANLGPGTYQLRVEARSQNFTADSLMRIAIDGAGVRIIDTPSTESVLVPADHPEVLTVGASDVFYTGSSALSGKPELLAPSRLRFDDGSTLDGSSAAAATAAAALAVWAGATGEKTREDIIAAPWLRRRGDARILQLPDASFVFGQQ